MQTIVTSTGKKINLYNDIDHMPIGRYNQFQCQVMQLVIGNTLDELNYKLSRLDQYLSKKQYDQALSERVLIQQNFHSALSKINYKTYAFACLIHDIDGKVYEDYSESGLSAIVTALEGTEIQFGEIKKDLDDIKKN